MNEFLKTFPSLKESIIISHSALGFSLRRPVTLVKKQSMIDSLRSELSQFSLLESLTDFIDRRTDSLDTSLRLYLYFFPR